MERRRRLVFAWNYLSWGGAQVYFLAIMKAARDHWDILVMLPAESSPEMVGYLDQLGIDHRFVDHNLDFSPAATLGRKLARQATRIKVEYRTFRELQKFDVRETVFHIEIAPWQSIAFLTAMSLRGATVFMTMHNFLPKSASWREAVWKLRFRIVSNLPGMNIFASNKDTKNQLRGWVTEEFWNRIKVTYTAVDPPQIEEAANAPFDRTQILSSIGIDRNDFIVLCVGQFIDRKGRWVLLEAARLIANTHNDISFVWLTPQMPSVEDQGRIDSYGLGDRFRLVLSESIGRERLDILKFFRIADVFTLPSYVEGLPIALLEAMALGRPSISTNVYAIPEAVIDMETGILIEAGDATALADSILRLKGNDSLRSKFSEDGSQFVMENFDERNVARIAIGQYERALEAGR